VDHRRYARRNPLVADIAPGPVGSEARSITYIGGGVAVFSADDGANGRELWITDGTAAGTMLRDLNPGVLLSPSSSPRDFTVITSFVPPPSTISLGDVEIAEGNNGTRLLTFTVARTGFTEAFSVNYATEDGTATIIDGDYQAISGTLSFAGGVNTQEITVTINGETLFELDEYFFVNLSGATNGTIIGDGQGVGTILADDPNPFIFTEGDDTIELPNSDGVWLALGGNDTVYGTDGIDAVYGGPGSDWLFGYGGNDLLQGEVGDDVLLGGDGDDLMYAGDGLENVYGETGNDVLVGGPNFNILQGGDGADYLYFYYEGGLGYGGAGNDVLVGNLVVDVLIGEDGDDTFYGYGGNDYFYGQNGNDVMFGGDGVDVLIGGDGDDYFDGGSGVNYYFGGDGGGPGSGRGNDTFNVTFDEINVVQDWTQGLDRVQLVGSGFSSFADVLAHSYQNGSYFIVQPNPNMAVWLNGANAGSVTAADFGIVS
jgi:ELWxxDGT repeat protein